MIHRVLLAVDHSRCAEEAARVAADLAAALHAEVGVLHVHEAAISASVFSPEELERASVETAEAADRLVERTVRRLRGRGVVASGSVRPADGTTAARIVAAAAEDRADLLVLGALGASRWRARLVGGVTHAVVQHAPCPVLVVPRHTIPGDMRRLVLGVDGSAGAARAVDLTSELAARLGAAVLVVHAADGSPADHEPDAIAAAAAEAVGHDRVAAVRVRAAGEGGVADALRDEALEFAAGLLVVGRRGRSAVQRLLLGGVSERLLHTASCPLLVVPPPGTTSPSEAGRTGPDGGT
jgi:nucleotide-binding universal stress UspA family protein